MEAVLQEELEKDYGSYCRWWDWFRRLMRPVFWLAIGYRGEKIPYIEGPVLILHNHTTDIDFALLAASSYSRGYFVASSTVERNGRIGKWACDKYHIIRHDKGGSGIETTRAILERIKWGYGIVLAPEGNRSFNGETCPIPASTGKLARISGATLITYRFSGGYLTSPRWGKGFRRGRIRGQLMGIYTPEQLQSMNAREIQAQIEKDLGTEALDEQKKPPVRYRSRKRAEYLETLIYLCPGCKKLGTLHSKGDRISCGCGYSFRFSEYGYLTDDRGRKCSIPVLDRNQKRVFREILAGQDSGQMLFSDRLTEQTIDFEGKITGERQVTVAAYKDHLDIDDWQFDWGSVQDVSIVQRNELILHIRGMSDHYEYKGSPVFNAVKYKDLFEKLRSYKEK